MTTQPPPAVAALEEMMSTKTKIPPPPKGFSILAAGEEIVAGSKWYSAANKKWLPISGGAGRRVGQMGAVLDCVCLAYAAPKETSAKNRAAKPQPKPLDPLEIMVINQIDAEDESDLLARKAELDNSRESRIAVRLAEAQASIRGELSPNVPDPLAGVPEADSGEALVGRWCHVYESGSRYAYLDRVESFKDGAYFTRDNCRYDHASPIERGIPEAIRKAVEG